MKLAEALAKRADLQQRIHELEQRLYRSAQVQMGDNPPEDPEALLSEIDRSYTELQQMICAIDRTNATAQLDGTSLQAILAERAILRARRETLGSLIDRCAIIPNRQTKSEIRFVNTIKPARLQQEADELAQRFRELDLKLQAANWSIDLIEDTPCNACDAQEQLTEQEGSTTAAPESETVPLAESSPK